MVHFLVIWPYTSQNVCVDMCHSFDNDLFSHITVFGVEPDLTREGGSIPVTLTFQEATGKNVMLLPIGASDDGAHSQNEKIDKYNYINGVSID